MSTWTILDKDRAEVQLSCGHLAAFAPAPYLGDTVYCQRCVDYRIVSNGGKTRNRKIYAKCRNCKYKRHEPTINGAIQRADVHAIREAHTVDVRQGRDRIVTTSLPLP